MEIKDESSPPTTKKLGVPRDITFDHDSWDSCSYLLESYPDVIDDIESSLNSSKDARSTRALLGYDVDAASDNHNGLAHFANSFETKVAKRGGSGRYKGRIKMEEPDDIKIEVGEEENNVDSSFADVQMRPMSNMEGRIKMEEPDDIKIEGGEEENNDDSSFADVQMHPMSNMEGDDDEMIVIDEEEEDDADEEYDYDIADGGFFFEDYSKAGGGSKGKGGNGRGREQGQGDGTHGSQEEEEEDDDDEEEDDEGEEMDDDDEEEGEEIEEWDSDSEGDLDALLDEGLPEEYKQTKGQQKVRKKAGEVWRKVVPVGGSLPEGLIGVKEKTVLRKRGQEPLEGLPDGWIRIAHQCGMPLYLHRPTRVCTWSRPYLLGSGSARRHHVPVASVPCLHYRRALDKEKQPQKEDITKDTQNEEGSEKATVNLPNGTCPHEARIAPSEEGKDVTMETAETGAKDNDGNSKVKGQQLKKGKIHICEDDSVDGKEFHEYLSRLFEFEKIAIKRFKSWAARRKHTKALKSKDRPQFPGGPKMIRCQIPGNKGREFVINAQDKTPVCILHEYSQRVMRTQPQYIFGVSNNASAPFEAIVEIQGERYGRGEASSKRLAKAEAAKATLDILVPELVADMKMKSNTDTEYFDHVAIDDSRVYDLCVKAGQLTPWQVLQEYRQRSHGLTDTELKIDIKLKNHQRSQYTLVLGPHKVTGMCKNKTTGKQQGAQKLLKQLHPNLRSWGAIIKMYGKGSSEMNRVKKEAEQSVIVLADLKRRSRPNTEILNKLREEMLKSYGEKEWLEEEMDRQKNQPPENSQGMEDMEEETQKEPS